MKNLFKLPNLKKLSDLAKQHRSALAMLPYRRAEGLEVAVRDDTVLLGCCPGCAVTLGHELARSGRALTIKDEDGGSMLNPITVDAENGLLFDGATSVTLAENYGALRLYCDGTAWHKR